ncbi:uncharacterized protein G2W53_043149 [Senna tora]|uniref:Uncharacterized protein n=1 Tax=Senna tora TaxID=362788 RepID=A0A834SHA8_9FABA|nr:uncharacterized protein G2W53_043149 [Senna tora]
MHFVVSTARNPTATLCSQLDAQKLGRRAKENCINKPQKSNNEVIRSFEIKRFRASPEKQRTKFLGKGREREKRHWVMGRDKETHNHKVIKSRNQSSMTWRDTNAYGIGRVGGEAEEALPLQDKGQIGHCDLRDHENWLSN